MGRHLSLSCSRLGIVVTAASAKLRPNDSLRGRTYSLRGTIRQIVELQFRYVLPDIRRFRWRKTTQIDEHYIWKKPRQMANVT